LLAFIAAEKREFSGFLANAERLVKIDWPIDFARKVWLNGRAAVLVANGPGPKLAGQAVELLKGAEDLKGLVSTGFCGGLDPALQPCDIFVADEILTLSNSYSNHDRNPDALPSRDRQGAIAPKSLADARGSVIIGSLLSMDRVATGVAEKAELRKTGASAVEMEAAAVAAKALEWNVPFYCIRVVTDTASESFPLDFNRLRDAEGRFSRTRIVGAALLRPLAFPELMKLNKRCNAASKALGDFVASCRF
jgi:adenosylhomocysteine nucleosidase